MELENAVGTSGMAEDRNQIGNDQLRNFNNETIKNRKLWHIQTDNDSHALNIYCTRSTPAERNYCIVSALSNTGIKFKTPTREVLLRMFIYTELRICKQATSKPK